MISHKELIDKEIRLVFWYVIHFDINVLISEISNPKNDFDKI